MKRLTNPLNRDLENRFRRRMAQKQGQDVERDKRLDLEDIKYRIATYKQRWGEDPEL